MQVSRRPLIVLLTALSLSACNRSTEKPRSEAPEVSVASVKLQDVTLTQQYVAEIQAHRHIEVRTPHSGSITVAPKSGQSFQEGDVLFQIGTPPAATVIKAPFAGAVSRILHPEGEFVEEGETLTNLFDASQVRVYFNVPELRYLEYHAEATEQDKDEVNFELQLPDGSKFHHQGKLIAIAGQFNKQTGSIAFRADFPNPEGRLRHGEAATVLISRPQEHAIVIPQRATFEIANRRYVFVVDQNDVAHEREIFVQNEFDDRFVLKSGLEVDEKIIVDGIRRVLDGSKVVYQQQQPNEVAAKLASQNE